MLIAVIKAQLKSGMLDKQGLQGLASTCVPLVSTPVPTSVPGLQAYSGSMSQMVVHTCAPAPGSHANFLWLNDRNFEVVVETFLNGHLTRGSEAVVAALVQEFTRRNIKADVEVQLRSTQDGQTYVLGAMSNRWTRLKAAVSTDVVALMVFCALIPISYKWLDQYFQESIAVVIAQTLLLLVKAIQSLRSRNLLSWEVA